MKEWKEVKLGDVATQMMSGGTPSTRKPEYYNGNIAWLNTKEINFNRIKTTEKTITEEGFSNSSAKWVPCNSIIIAMYGATAAKVAINKIPLTTNQACCNMIIANNIADYRYVFYCVFNSYDELENLATGAAQQNLNLRIIADFDILLPPLKEQKVIAEVLSNLDDKIELLQKQNETLEQLAETLFRQWFIEEAEEDWEEYIIQDIANHLKKNVQPNLNTITKYYHYSLPSFDNGKLPNIEYGRDIRSNKYLLCENVILVSKLNPRFPRIWPVTKLSSFNSICSTEFVVLKPSKNMFLFLYFLLKNKRLVDYLIVGASGTSGSHQRVKPDYIMNYRFKGDKKRIAFFTNIVSPYFTKIESNQLQIQTLTEMRDTLLPKLMSGEVRVKLPD